MATAAMIASTDHESVAGTRVNCSNVRSSFPPNVSQVVPEMMAVRDAAPIAVAATTRTLFAV